MPHPQRWACPGCGALLGQIRHGPSLLLSAADLNVGSVMIGARAASVRCANCGTDKAWDYTAPTAMSMLPARSIA